MATQGRPPVKAYRNRGFLNSREARALRILAEYLEPKSRLERYHVDDTIVFMGSARIRPPEQARDPAARRSAGRRCRDVRLLRSGA